VSKVVEKLKDASETLKEHLEWNLETLKKGFINDDLRRKIQESAPFLPEALVEERFLDLSSELKVKNEAYYKELSIETDIISSLVTYNQKLLKQYQEVSQTQDFNALCQWYSYIPQHLQYIDKIGNITADFYLVVVYHEIFPIDYKKIGFVTKRFDDKSEVWCRQSVSADGLKEITFNKNEFLTGRYQSVRRSIRDIYYNDRGEKMSEVIHVLGESTVVLHDYVRGVRLETYLDGRVRCHSPEGGLSRSHVQKKDGWYYFCSEERRQHIENGRYENGVLVERPYQKPWYLTTLIKEMFDRSCLIALV
jgi:hypothetical protein